MASRTPTSVNQVPPGTEMPVTPDRSTVCTLRAAFSVENSGPRGAAAFALAFDDRITVGDVAMGIDHAGHDPLPGGVDHPDVAAVIDRDLRRQRAHALDPVALDDDGVVAPLRLAGAVDQRPVANDGCFRSAAAMAVLL